MPFLALCYHRISSAAADPLGVRPEQLQAQLQALARRGLVGVSLGAAWAAEHARAPGRRIALTFDDGTADFADLAWPLLRAHGCAATLAVVTSRVGRTADWDGPRGAPLLDWPALRALAAEGVEVIAHAHTHRPLDTLAPAEALADLRAARRALRDHLGGAAGHGLAYPYGRVSPALALAAQAAGFAWAVTARGGRNTAATPAHRLRRTLLHGRDGALRLALKLWLGYAALVEWRMDLRGLP
ncbi:MAG: polysaccharide deacetylase family protein [Anaerolineales bacterium]|nr:polysaccharide deacetylase family protein [Anaerolineales bacterium]